jgi:hypothetical protein
MARPVSARGRCAMITLGEQAEDVGEGVINLPTTRSAARSPMCWSPGHWPRYRRLARADHCAAISHACRAVDAMMTVFRCCRACRLMPGLVISSPGDGGL